MDEEISAFRFTTEGIYACDRVGLSGVSDDTFSTLTGIPIITYIHLRVIDPDLHHIARAIRWGLTGGQHGDVRLRMNKNKNLIGRGAVGQCVRHSKFERIKPF